MKYSTYIVIILMALLTACTKAELCDDTEHPHRAGVQFAFDWANDTKGIMTDGLGDNDSVIVLSKRIIGTWVMACRVGAKDGNGYYLVNGPSSVPVLIMIVRVLMIQVVKVLIPMLQELTVRIPMIRALMVQILTILVLTILVLTVLALMTQTLKVQALMMVAILVVVMVLIPMMVLVPMMVMTPQLIHLQLPMLILFLVMTHQLIFSRFRQACLR